MQDGRKTRRTHPELEEFAAGGEEDGSKNPRAMLVFLRHDRYIPSSIFYKDREGI